MDISGCFDCGSVLARCLAPVRCGLPKSGGLLELNERSSTRGKASPSRLVSESRPKRAVRNKTSVCQDGSGLCGWWAVGRGLSLVWLREGGRWDNRRHDQTWCITCRAVEQQGVRAGKKSSQRTAACVEGRPKADKREVDHSRARLGGAACVFAGPGRPNAGVLLHNQESDKQRRLLVIN
ncbi:hypothetical protein BS50DRAFT_123854 [Corynespora cassiicola Philippines]|uniref:Uncharacterized protein n=1 Tax=Corynespora cassiicola Philippines TaxID=1448308 RepID=A0A2T2NC42_CORCC|nr:hypothetical protein BS50DRAFT_123854 [Corynespora cassiicola Philippines]